jgi:hypothetical protein
MLYLDGEVDFLKDPLDKIHFLSLYDLQSSAPQKQYALRVLTVLLLVR